MADSPITTPDAIATDVRAHAERIMKAAGLSLIHPSPQSHRVLAAVMDCYEQAYRAGTVRVASDLRTTAQNMRRYPFESATMAEAAVLAARELQNIADQLERPEA